MFEKYGLNEKDVIHKFILPFNFTIVWDNLVQVGSLVTEMLNFGENVCSIVYDINVFERYDHYEKKFTSKTILVFDFASVYPCFFSKSVA